MEQLFEKTYNGNFLASKRITIRNTGSKIALFIGISILLTSCLLPSLPNPPATSTSVSPAYQLPTPVNSAAVQASSTADGMPFENANLIFEEEFSGVQLNSANWTTEYRWGPINEPELQYYSPYALNVNNGILGIKAEKRAIEGMEYMSGMIASYDRVVFTFGYVEARAKIPAGQGLWPAFWLHLNDDSKTGEIDVFEILGHEPNIVYMTFHFPTPTEDSVDDGYWFEGPDYSQDYHTYAVDWKPDEIIWYIDGVERYRATHDIPSGPMYLLANLAVGGEWPGSPDETTPFPAYYEIDYIRVYQRKNP